MRPTLTITMVMLLALAGGCSQDANDRTGVATNAQPAAADATTAHTMTPEQLGELGAQIGKTPDRADALLGQHGLTRESFEAQIRKLTENPDASKRYAEAYRKANA